MDLFLHRGEIFLQQIEGLTRFSPCSLEHIDSRHPIEEGSELLRGGDRFPLCQVEGVHRFSGAEVKASLHFSLHLECSRGDLFTRRPPRLVDPNQSRKGGAEAVHLAPDPIPFIGMFEIEFDHTMIIVPVNQVGDRTAHHVMG